MMMVPPSPVTQTRAATTSVESVRLSMALSDNPRTRPLREGRVSADGVRLVITTLHPSEMFWRQLHFAEFDVSEMSMSSLMIAIANGDRRWVALPVFTSRSFYHTLILIRTDRGIERPEDLKGKRVAVPEYQQTAAVWSRGVLQHEFGVHASDIEWYMERTEDRSHGGATGFEPPEGLTVHRIPEHEDIGSMLIAGTIDASLLYLNTPNLVDRSRVDLGERPEIQTLFDPLSEGARYYAKMGFYPINHCVVLQREVVDANPWIVLNLFKAFEEAKNQGRRQSAEFATDYFDLGLLPPEKRSVVGTDLYPYGVQANRDALETLTRYSSEQGLTSRKLALDEIFHPATLDL
jgi:4,5-dihydroxyphthalate decarboxylase